MEGWTIVGPQARHWIFLTQPRGGIGLLLPSPPARSPQLLVCGVPRVPGIRQKVCGPFAKEMCGPL